MTTPTAISSAPALCTASDQDTAERGSITPLVIGMMVCLLILTAGVTAAGSAFLAGQRLQRLCDGAVAAAVGAVNPQRAAGSDAGLADPIAAANAYLQVRGPDVGAVVTLGATTVSAQCSNEALITFGALFGSPTLSRTVTATSEPIRRGNAAGPNWSLGEPAGTDAGFTPGPPVGITCQGAGLPPPADYDWKAQPSCGHMFHWRSTKERTGGTGTWPISATSNWTVTWQSNTGVTGGTSLAATATDAFDIGEYRTVLVRNPGG
jgi:hypothetical protein